MKTAEGRPGWPVISGVGDWIGECGSKHLSLFSCLSVQTTCFFYFIYHFGFYVAYLVIRRTCLILLWTAETFFLHYSQPWVSSDYHQFGVLMCETVWNIWSFQTHVSLRLHDMRCFLFLSSLLKGIELLSLRIKTVFLMSPWIQ